MQVMMHVMMQVMMMQVMMQVMMMQVMMMEVMMMQTIPLITIHYCEYQYNHGLLRTSLKKMVTFHQTLCEQT